MRQNSLFPINESSNTKLTAVFAKYVDSAPFSMELFDGFDSLRVLTYSASIPMIIKMLDRFQYFECIFGYEGVIQTVSNVLAFQSEVVSSVSDTFRSLADERQNSILKRISENTAKFFVTKDAIAHAKIYLLESKESKRVIVGSANLSDRALSGKQAETILIFDDDEQAWNQYEFIYNQIKQDSTSEFKLNSKTVTPKIEEIPIFEQIKDTNENIEVYVATDVEVTTVPIVIQRVEKLTNKYKTIIEPVAKASKGKSILNFKKMSQIVTLSKSKNHDEDAEEPTQLSISRESSKLLLDGNQISLETDWKKVQNDVKLLINYFENFHKGFHGDIERHQRDYFLFMSWFYFSPFICDLRNRAVVDSSYIFDYPLFAILYGKSNCGKTQLIKTLMVSMFGFEKFYEKSNFTGSNLRGLLHSTKRFPIIFDDVEKNRFTQHGSGIIKNENIQPEEHPAFVLSMNADNHSFPTEIHKRCLMIYTQASLPDNTEENRVLYKSVNQIRKSLTTSLYREYLRRVLSKFEETPYPQDMIQLSSEVIVSIFNEALEGNLPQWSQTIRIIDYHNQKFDQIKKELINLIEKNPDLWEVRRDDVIFRFQQAFEANALRKEIPDYLLKPGNKGRTIILEKHDLEEFLNKKLSKGWFQFLK